GSLATAVQRDLKSNPGMSYEEIHARHLRDRDGAIAMNQISPKIFEAIACRTALVLFEGEYSGVLEAGRHYLPLRKAFSNVDEVLAKLHDDDLLEAMTERAYADVIGSGRYSYQAFLDVVDRALEENWQGTATARPLWLPLPPCDALPTFTAAYG